MRYAQKLIDTSKNIYSDTVFDLFTVEPIRRQGCGLKSLLDSVQTDIQHADPLQSRDRDAGCSNITESITLLYLPTMFITQSLFYLPQNMVVNKTQSTSFPMWLLVEPLRASCGISTARMQNHVGTFICTSSLNQLRLKIMIKE